jgi:GTPase
LVAAFRSTLEEVRDADLLVHVIDGGDSEPLGQLVAVREVLAEIGAGGVAELVVVNKAELIDAAMLAEIQHRESGSLAVSAHTGLGLDDLRAALATALPQPEVRLEVVVPFSRGDLTALLHEQGQVRDSAYTGEGARISAMVPAWLAARLAEYRTDIPSTAPDHR